jgi:hypothetical protein
VWACEAAGAVAPAGGPQEIVPQASGLRRR